MRKSLIIMLSVAVLVLALFPQRVKASEGGGVYTYIFEYDRSANKNDGTLGFYNGDSGVWETVKFSNYGYKVTVKIKINVPIGYYVYCNVGGGAPYIGGYDIVNQQTVSNTDMVNNGMSYTVTSSHSDIVYTDFVVKYNYMADCTLSGDWMYLDYDTSSGSTIYSMFYCKPDNVIYTHDLSMDGDSTVMWNNIANYMGTYSDNAIGVWYSELKRVTLGINALTFVFDTGDYAIEKTKLSDTVVVEADGVAYTIPTSELKAVVKRMDGTYTNSISFKTAPIADYLGVETIELDSFSFGIRFMNGGEWKEWKYYTAYFESSEVYEGSSSESSTSSTGSIVSGSVTNTNTSGKVNNTEISNADNMLYAYSTGIAFLDNLLGVVHAVVDTFSTIVDSVADFIAFLGGLASTFFGSSIGTLVSMGLLTAIFLRIVGR